MKNSKNLLVRYLSIFLIFGSINIIAQDNDEAIEEVVVTGSYIKGSPTDGACLLYTSPSPRDSR